MLGIDLGLIKKGGTATKFDYILSSRFLDMDIERDVYKDFLDWKDNSDLVLLVEGARQVGKTYLSTKFANENFKNVIYINIADDTKGRIRGNM